jgi:hypothetical protein
MTTEQPAELTAQQMWDQELNGEATPPVVSETPVVAEPAPASAAPAETTPAAPVTPVPAVPAADPYAGLPDVVRNELQAAKLQGDRLRRVEGQIGGLMSENKRLQQEITTARTVAPTAVAPTATQVAAATVSTEKWKQLKGEFPEWADAIEERLGGLTPAQPNIDQLRATIKDELKADIQANETRLNEYKTQTEQRLVGIVHPGWLSTVKEKEFVDWMGKQPDTVRALAASPEAEDAIAMLNMYKATKAPVVDTAAIQNSRKQRLAEAASVARGNTAVTPVKSTDDMTDKEYWDYLAKHPEAVRS